MKQTRMIVAGSANIDLVTRVPRIPKPGESVIGHSFATITGGKGANQAVAAGRLGVETYFVGCVGNDGFGQLQRQSLREANVNVNHLKTLSSEATGTAVIMVSDEGQNSIVVTPSANFGLTPEDIGGLESLFRQADVVLMQLEIPLETVDAVLEMSRRCGVFSIVDAGPAQQVPAALVAKADIVSPNETEAEAITGIHVDSVENARKAAQALLAMGARHAVMKLGAQGSLYVGEGEHYAPPFKVTAVDTTAAGDAFTAALGAVWKHLPVPEALLFANAAGALAATAAGAQPSMPTFAMVETFLRSNG